MKNREYKTMAAIILAMSLTAGLLGTTAPATLYAKDSTGTPEASADKKGSNKTSDARPMKDETVYAKIDGTGTIMSVTVSDQLKNITDLSKISDVSSLDHIENVKGNETFSTDKGTLTWDGDSKDICYQGNTKQQLPVGVEISYKLDGKDIPADELTGKSGHLQMRYQYKNTTGNAKEKYIPFLMITGLILDSDKFSNVQVSNGKLISDGDRDMALFIGLPKVKENLGVTDLNIPDSFEMEADVKDYEAIEGITIATNDVFRDFSTEKLDSLSDLKHSMNQLQDSANRLVDGSGELSKGLNTLLSSSGGLADGIQQLVNGGGTLKTGAQALLGGSGMLASGSNALADGTGLLLSGSGDLYAGTKELNSGLNLAYSKVSGELLPGVKALDTGVFKMQKSLGSKLPSLCEGTAALCAGADQAANGAAALNTGIQQAADGVSALSNGMGAVASGISGLNQGTQKAAEAASMLSTDAGQLKDLVSANTFTENNTDTTDSRDEISQLQTLKDSLSTCEDLPEGTLESLDGVIASLGDEQNQRCELQSAPVSNSGLSQLAEKVAGEATMLQYAFNGNQSNPGLTAAAASLDAAVNSGNPDGGIPSIIDAANSLDAAINTGDPSKGVPSIRAGAAALDAALNTGSPENKLPGIKDGIHALNEGINGKNGLNAQVNAGVSQLKDGTSQVLNGIDGSDGLAGGLKQLSFGASKINSGASTLNEKMAEADNGAKSVSAGAGELSNGAGQLNEGAQTLDAGIHALQNGSGALIDGVKQLDTGAATLNEGMIQFNEEGIKKLVKAFDGDINGLLDKLNHMIDASKSYKNFTGIADGMDGDVKFIFVSDK